PPARATAGRGRRGEPPGGGGVRVLSRGLFRRPGAPRGKSGQGRGWWLVRSSGPWVVPGRCGAAGLPGSVRWGDAGRLHARFWGRVYSVSGRRGPARLAYELNRQAAGGPDTAPPALRKKTAEGAQA